MDVYRAAEQIIHDSLEIVHGVELKHKRKAKVTKIIVAVGELSGLDLKELSQVLAGLIEDSVLDSPGIELVEVPGTVACRCGFHGRPKLFSVNGRTIAECPKCRKEELLVHGGEGVEIQNVELA
jgi:Zn finger protein HypA/HybF involved in hydrogenase expression